MENEKKQKFKKPKGSKMSDEQTTTSNEPLYRVIGFVSGSEDEQKEQKSRIKFFFAKKGYISKTGNTAETGIEFVSEWYKINNDLESGDYIIIADLTDLSRNYEDLATRLLVPLKKGVQVQPVNKEQRKSLKWEKSWDEHLGDMKHYYELFDMKSDAENAMLIELKKWVKQIFPDTES